MSLSFTVILKGNDSSQIAYTLAYEPCAEWKFGNKFVTEMYSEGPHYKKCEFKKLLEYHEKSRGSKVHPNKKCIIICNNVWEHSRYDDSNTLSRLREDIESEGFNVETIEL